MVCGVEMTRSLSGVETANDTSTTLSDQPLLQLIVLFEYLNYPGIVSFIRDNLPREQPRIAQPNLHLIYGGDHHRVDRYPITAC